MTTAANRIRGRGAIWLVAIVCVGACQSPGVGAKADDGYRRSQVIIDALGRYRAEHGRYPDDLKALVPRLIDPSQLAPPQDPARNFPFEYHREHDGEFELSFTYSGPGLNRCTYTSKTRAWKCRGAF